jgi:hypothetical protein
MKTTTRLLLLACLSMPLLVACNKGEDKPAVVEAPLVAPTTNEGAAWDTYLTEVVKRNIEGATNVYLYTLPDPAGADFEGEYARQLEKAQGDVGRRATSPAVASRARCWLSARRTRPSRLTWRSPRSPRPRQAR